MFRKKQLGLLDAHIRFYEQLKLSLEHGRSLSEILEMPLREELSNLKNYPDEEFDEKLGLFYENMDKIFT